MRARRISSKDNALTIPGRVTFPKGSYISEPPPRQAYRRSPGTPASGVSGFQGQHAAMYPAGGNPPPSLTLGNPQWGNMLQQGSQYGPLGTAYAASNIAAELGRQVGQNTMQGSRYMANQIGNVSNNINNAYLNAYANVPNSAIPYIAMANPGLAYSFLNSRQLGNMGGRTGYVPGAPNYGYNVDMRGRGYTSQPPGYGTNDAWYRTPEQAASEAAALQRIQSGTMQTPGFVDTPIGAGSEEFMNTRFMQQNIKNNVQFANQLRWDPDRGKYVQLGKLIKEGRLNLKTGKLGKKKRRGGDDEPAPVYAPAPVEHARAQPVQQAVPQSSIANMFVSFRA